MSNQTFEKLYDDKGNRVDGYFFDPSNDIIHFIKSIDGRIIKFSTGVKRPKIAQAKKEAGRKLKEKLGTKKSNVSTLIGDELKKYEKVKATEGHDPRYFNLIKRCIRQIRPFWEDKFPHEIDADNMADFYIWFKETYPDIGMDNPLKTLRNFATYLSTKVVNGKPLLPAIPKMKDPDAAEVKARRKKAKENIFEIEDVNRVIEAADIEDPSLTVEERRILISIMYTMCTRIEETLNMRFGDQVLFEEDSCIYRWTIGQNKADLWGQHHFPSKLVPRLKALYEKRKKEGTDLLFPQKRDNKKPLKPQQIKWDKWREKANLPFHWSSHTCRHSGLSRLFNDERNPQALILMLYRVSLRTALDTYVKGTKSGREKMKEAIEVPAWD